MGRMYTSRFLHYAPNQGVLTAHTDFAVLTILHQDLNGGLQIHHNDRWMDVPPIENTFLINVGDMLQHWSEGQLKSTAHRVIYHDDIKAHCSYRIPEFQQFS
ncbi:unnamed protein product [Rotaria sordida]|uniref:Fe2OG dioxygenase domain-containing protein n=1 Tax=Rotaria sordida TaxID=392033 RepID=A0A819PQ18_9BILA|nr:unnamed protein product [Rotaria sordida]